MFCSVCNACALVLLLLSLYSSSLLEYEKLECILMVLYVTTDILDSCAETSLCSLKHPTLALRPMLPALAMSVHGKTKVRDMIIENADVSMLSAKPMHSDSQKEISDGGYVSVDAEHAGDASTTSLKNVVHLQVAADSDAIAQ